MNCLNPLEIHIIKNPLEIHTIKSHMALEKPLRKSNLGQNSISSLGTSILNILSNDLKILNPATSFTHNHKKLAF